MEISLHTFQDSELGFVFTEDALRSAEAAPGQVGFWQPGLTPRSLIPQGGMCLALTENSPVRTENSFKAPQLCLLM